MLILTRRPSERIIMTLEDGREIVFVVCGIQGMQVRIGIEADKSITIVREEIKDKPKIA